MEPRHSSHYTNRPSRSLYRVHLAAAIGLTLRGQHSHRAARGRRCIDPDSQRGPDACVHLVRVCVRHTHTNTHTLCSDTPPQLQLPPPSSSPPQGDAVPACVSVNKSPPRHAPPPPAPEQTTGSRPGWLFATASASASGFCVWEVCVQVIACQQSPWRPNPCLVASFARIQLQPAPPRTANFLNRRKYETIAGGDERRGRQGSS
ncbi:hypothetical protein E2C01_001848 [Portunus trituberculatus]|uniref:Uncharacterized protein n=1 Tax=Portunus trituberculatus TaxID=210409 RepID=A0A5B7CIZ4_PORTR|nr:hypothetical protein [Portunus trituberculatus]